MSDEVNIARINITLNDDRKLSSQLEFPNSQLIINDALLLLILEKAKCPDSKCLKSCSIELGVNNIAINIKGYTLTDTISFSGFYNMPSNISIFQSHNTNVHIVDQRIDLLQVDCQTVLLANCQVRQIDIGLAEHHAALVKATETGDNSLPTAYKMKSIDFRECRISGVYAYVECNNINIQRSVIGSLNYIGGFGSTSTAIIKRLHVWQYSEIDACEIHCQISDFIIEESNVSSISAKAKCLIEKLTFKDALITTAHNFEKKHFSVMSLDAWILISKSATNARNFNTRSEANYQIAREIYKREIGINRIVNCFFGACSGYGYKPIRVWLSCVCLVFVAFLLHMIADWISLGVGSLTKISQNIAYSFSALAGQSGLELTDGFKFWIATTEYIFGVVLFAMFVNAIYVRYKD